MARNRLSLSGPWEDIRAWWAERLAAQRKSGETRPPTAERPYGAREAFILPGIEGCLSSSFSLSPSLTTTSLSPIRFAWALRKRSAFLALENTPINPLSRNTA